MELFRSEEMQLMQVRIALVHAIFTCWQRNPPALLVQNPDECFVVFAHVACFIYPHFADDDPC